MPRTLTSALLAAVVACGARTSLDPDIVGAVDGSTANGGAIDTGTGHGADAAPQGMLCAWLTGVVSACEAGESAGPVQRCEPGEECSSVLFPPPDAGPFGPAYACCVGEACVLRQMFPGYVCQ